MWLKHNLTRRGCNRNAKEEKFIQSISQTGSVVSVIRNFAIKMGSLRKENIEDKDKEEDIAFKFPLNAVAS